MNTEEWEEWNFRRLMANERAQTMSAEEHVYPLTMPGNWPAAPPAVPYAEQQIRALCLVAAATTSTDAPAAVVKAQAIIWRKFIQDGNWDG